MEFNLDIIEELYGIGMINSIKENMESVKNNILYLKKRGFNEIDDLFVNYPFSFTFSEDIFKERVDLLIDNLGVEFLEKIKNNFSLWEEIENE